MLLNLLQRQRTYNMVFENNQVTDFALPNIEALVFKPIEKSYLKIVYVNYVLLFLVLIGLCFGAVYVLDFSFSNPVFTIAVIVAFVFYFFRLIVSILGFKKRMFAVRTKDISYKSGLLLSKLTTVPFARVQHTEVAQGLFSRKLGLAKLEVYTAGESGGDLTIKGLKKEEANSLREFIMNKVNE